MENNKKLVTIHGPSFDGSGEIVERKVVRQDVAAFVKEGYVEGGIPEKEFATAGVTYSEADAIAQNDGKDVTKPKGRKKK